jgi:pSer/pThr/pTyr-binding forkhead associated (FHA) protein/anti-anti-sigma regulatory factor
VDPKRYQQIKSILMDGLDLPAADREALLAERCGNDLELRREVESLLQQAVQEDFLDPIVSLDRDPLIGTTVAGYRILRPLGEGGMGVVYLAEDERLQRPAALKFLRPELVLDESAKTRFIREARAGAALDHPNICPLYGIEETADGGLFLAMRFYDGETLKHRLGHGDMPLELSLDIAIQMADGLAHAHQAGIVHRDVKPGNVLLTNGIVKILDFGIAKVRNHEPLTTRGSALGTASYMSPEQQKGDDVDHRTDIWSLGVVLGDMAGDHAAVAHIIQKATAHDVRDRYQSMAEIAAALTDVRRRLAHPPDAEAQGAAARIAVDVRRDGRVVWSGQFDRDQIVLGRSPQSDVVLDDVKVSWTHAVVWRAPDGSLSFADRSSNGSFLNGRRVIDTVSLGGAGVVAIKPFELDVSIHNVAQHPKTVHIPGDTTPNAFRPAHVRFVRGPAALVGRTFALGEKKNLVGRSEDCEVWLDFPSISRRHASIYPAGDGGWIVEDTGSRNGVVVEGKRVEAARIKAGDQVGFGSEIVAMLETAGGDSRDGQDNGSFTFSFGPSRLDTRIDVAHVAGHVDSRTSLALQDHFTKAIGTATRFLVVDLLRFSSCDQSGFAVFIGVDMTLRRRGGALHLVALGGDVLATYRSLRLDTVLSVRADEAAAVAELSALLKRL